MCKSKERFVAFVVFVCATCRCFAWDVEHDELAQLTGETLPAEIKAQFDFDDFEPLAYLDNGDARFCFAARRGNVTWLPVYLLSPFLFSDVKALDFGELRLDPFAARLLMDIAGRDGR